MTAAANVLERIAKAECADPASDDLTAVLAIKLAEAHEEINRLRTMLETPLCGGELRAVDRHCDWIAFKHAWNALMNYRNKRMAEHKNA